MLFHVTSVDNVESIWESGITGGEVTESWQERRREMRQLLDSEGRKRKTNWVNREGALFFWCRYSDAQQYAKRTGLDAIVEVDVSPADAWMVNNQVVERMFEIVEQGSGEITGNEEVLELVDEFFSSAYEWDGSGDSGFEVWLQPPVYSGDIVQITDLNGEPFDL